MNLDRAKTILRARESAEPWQIAEAALAVLEHAEGMESRARRLYEKADPGERRDAVLENVRSACGYILGEGSSVRLARQLTERSVPATNPEGQGQ